MADGLSDHRIHPERCRGGARGPAVASAGGARCAAAAGLERACAARIGQGGRVGPGRGAVDATDGQDGRKRRASPLVGRALGRAGLAARGAGGGRGAGAVPECGFAARAGGVQVADAVGVHLATTDGRCPLAQPARHLATFARLSLRYAAAAGRPGGRSGTRHGHASVERCVCARHRRSPLGVAAQAVYSRGAGVVHDAARHGAPAMDARSGVVLRTLCGAGCTARRRWRSVAMLIRRVGDLLRCQMPTQESVGRGRNRHRARATPDRCLSDPRLRGCQRRGAQKPSTAHVRGIYIKSRRQGGTALAGEIKSRGADGPGRTTFIGIPTVVCRCATGSSASRYPSTDTPTRRYGNASATDRIPTPATKRAPAHRGHGVVLGARRRRTHPTRVGECGASAGSSRLSPTAIYLLQDGTSAGAERLVHRALTTAVDSAGGDR
eukprot:ctg_83.g30